jgi:flavin reductase (DIM6/NTAB) family NADH-FMN oxidoreductase RutF
MTSPASRFEPVALGHASRLLNHGPTVWVTSAHEGRRNVMAAAWSMPVEFTPPRVAVVIDKRTYTYELVQASGTFGLVVPAAGLADATYAFGSSSGRDFAAAKGRSSAAAPADKFAACGIAVDRIGPLLGMPLVERGCLAWLECRLIPEPHAQQAYDTCFAEVVAAAADARAFAHGRWLPRPSEDALDLHTLHHLGGGLFAVAGRTVQARTPG